MVDLLMSSLFVEFKIKEKIMFFLSIYDLKCGDFMFKKIIAYFDYEYKY